MFNVFDGLENENNSQANFFGLARFGSLSERYIMQVSVQVFYPSISVQNGLWPNFVCLKDPNMLLPLVIKKIQW